MILRHILIWTWGAVLSSEGASVAYRLHPVKTERKSVVPPFEDTWKLRAKVSKVKEYLRESEAAKYEVQGLWS